MRFWGSSKVQLPIIELAAAVISVFIAPACQSPGQSDPPKPTRPTESAPASAAPSASLAPEPPAAAPSASSVSPAAAPIVTSIDPESVNALLVWQKDDKARGKFRSQWIVRDGDKAKIAGERPGILFVSNSSLFTLEFKIVKGCSQYARHPNGDVFAINGVPQYARPDMQMPEVTRISDGAKVAPWKDGHGYPYTGTQCPELEEYSVNVTFEGGMGPFVAARRYTYEFAGGAHGIRGSEPYILDLDKLEKSELLPRAEDRSALLASAAKGLSVKLEDVRPNGTLPLYGPNGSAVAVYRYLGFSDYAGGTGGNSYSNDFDVSSKNVPPELQGYSKLPAWALSLLKPKAIPIFMIPPGKTDAFKAQFDAAYADAK